MSKDIERGSLLSEVNALMGPVRDVLEEERKRNDFHTYKIDLREEVKEPIPVLSIEGMTICSEGNISTIVGEAKSRKTFLCSALVAGYIHRYQQPILGSDPRPGNLVLWVDTEQSKAHVQLMNKRILAMASHDTFYNYQYLQVLALREMDPKMRSKMLFEAIAEYKPKLVVIDGVSDLLYNTNDLEESERLITQLMRTSSRMQNHILMVLHTNPNSDKARGHIGSALQRKSESVIYVRRTGDCSIVEPQYCRNEPFDRFAFRINAEGIPVTCPLPNFAATEQQEFHQAVQAAISEIPGKCCDRETLITRLVKRLDCSRRAASMRILRAVRDGILLQTHHDKQGRQELRLITPTTPVTTDSPST